jgi:dinuclear metal center YbgI/SA1388 family protein
MTKLNTLIKFLNKELKVSKIKDSSKNGLQARGKSEVRKIAFGVDACMELFKKAKAKKCDLVIVHHGLLWKPQKREELLKKRISFLKKNKISMYAAHAPLDSHPTLGNNAQLAKILDAKLNKKFGYADDVWWGYSGTIKPTTINKIKNIYDKKLKTKSRLLNFGNKKIQKIGFCSGGGSFVIPETKKQGLDILITGEIKHGNYHTTKELAINVIAAGHYATETLGVKALAEPLKQKFKINTEFIDVPTRL